MHYHLPNNQANLIEPNDKTSLITRRKTVYIKKTYIFVEPEKSANFISEIALK